jgi:hypothetical protein
VQQAITTSPDAMPDCRSPLSLAILEARAERWPNRARVAVNEHDPLRRAEALVTLAPVWESARRLRAMSMWTAMVCFATYCHEEGALEDLGLDLEDEYECNLFDVGDLAMGKLTHIQLSTEANVTAIWLQNHKMFWNAMRQRPATARNNILLWWMGIHVMSAVTLAPGEEDYITRGRFRENLLPMDLDLRGRAAAMTHFAKIITLEDALRLMRRTNKATAKEIRTDLDRKDLSWMAVEGGQRPFADDDAGAYEGAALATQAAWVAMLRVLDREVNDVFAKVRGTAMARIVQLEGMLAQGPARTQTQAPAPGGLKRGREEESDGEDEGRPAPAERPGLISQE